ncbi:M60 family metallopeptidase [Streptomyces lavendulae]|uniref:M60 family metallopeptidase n=1 Tax=Streptomyces lavendulae TaxID=1914 RepID=UPI0033D3B661
MPPEHSFTGAVRPTVSGQGLNGALVTLRVGGVVYGSAVAAGHGHWTIEPERDLPAVGVITLEVVQELRGLTSTAARDVHRDASTPPRVVSALIARHPDGGGVVDYRLSGLGLPGAVVEFRASHEQECEAAGAAVGEDGTWSLTVTRAADDLVDLTAFVRQGREGTLSPEASVYPEVDVPRVERPRAYAETGGSSPEFTGTALPGASITVSVAGHPYGIATADGDGRWSLRGGPDLPVRTGETNVTVQQAWKNRFNGITHPLWWGLDAPRVALAEIRQRYTGNHDLVYYLEGSGHPGAVVNYRSEGGSWNWDIPVGPDGLWKSLSYQGGDDSTVRFEFRHVEGGVVSRTVLADLVLARPELTGPEGDTVTGPLTVIAGKGVKGAIVTVTLDGTDIGTALVDDRGTWTLTPDADIPGGVRTLTAVQTLRELTSPAHARKISVTEVFGLRQPANGAHTGPLPVFGGAGKTGALITVTVDGVTYPSVTVTGGVWTWSVRDTDGGWTHWAPGEHRIRVTHAPLGGPTTAQELTITTRDVRTAVIPPHPQAVAERTRTGTAQIFGSRGMPTGLYLPADTPLTVTVRQGTGLHLSASAVAPGNRPRHLAALTAGENTVPASTGGMLYLSNGQPEGTGETAVVEFGDEALPAAHFVLGESSSEQYRWMLTTYTDVPLTELVSPRAIVTFPHEWGLEFQDQDHTELMELYETIIEAQDAYNGLTDTEGIHRGSPLKHHLVLNTQGLPYATDHHTGYPPTGHALLITESLRNAWVVFHEVGHQHQMRTWAFGGHFTESAVNIYSLAAQYRLGQVSRLLSTYSNGQECWDRALKRRGWDFGKLEQWADRVCVMWQLVLAFGEDFYPRMHRLMREDGNPPVEGGAPSYYHNWSIYACRASGRNLMDFFQEWGMNLTEETRRAIGRMRLAQPTLDFSVLRELRKLTVDSRTDASPPFLGKGTPGAVMTITDHGGTAVATATVADDGNWQAEATVPLTPGQQLTAHQTLQNQQSNPLNFEFGEKAEEFGLSGMIAGTQETTTQLECGTSTDGEDGTPRRDDALPPAV